MKIWAKTKEFSEGKFLVVRRDGTVPHWPHFVLGARDAASQAALRAYADKAEELQYEPQFVASVRELANEDFPLYLQRHGCGDPEAAPHREDHPDVIRAMRGETVTFQVRPDKGNTPK